METLITCCATRRPLLIAASVLTTGWFTGEVGLLYRKWPGPQDVTGGILIDTDEVALAGRAGLQ